MEKEPNFQENQVDEVEKSHQQASDFVERNRDFFEHYARGGIKFAPAPEGLNTFAFNLKDNTIYISPKFYEKLGFSDEKTSFATCHEVEHFLEKIQILSEDGGEKEFEKYLNKIGKSKAYGLMDNCVADVRENRAIVEKTHEGFGQIEQKCYKEDLFAKTDFTGEPRHIQFSYALLREARVPDEQCTVSEEVREQLTKFKEIKGRDDSHLFDVMTDPKTPMSTRLKLQDRFIWPIVKDFLDKDMEDEKKKEQEKQEKGKGEKEDNGSKESGKEEDVVGKEKSAKSGKPQKLDPNEVFKEAYERAGEKVPNAVPIEEIKKAFEEWKEEQKENSTEKADKEYAEKLGVKKEDLQKYRDIVKSLNDILNPETNETVIEELRSIFSRIIAKRLKPTLPPRYPMEEGEDLADPAQLVADVKGGNLEPKVWETWETKEKRGQRFGEIEITLVCDRSGSMDEDGGNKKIEQQKAAVLIMETMKEFAKICDEERVNVEKPLEVRSEIYSFQSDENDSKPLKKMSKDLGEKERVNICGILSTTSGSTTDFVPLETIAFGIDEDMKKKIHEGEVKKIIIVFTDGGSDDKLRVQKALENLRSVGVVTVCVAITESGRPALETYKPDGRLAETAEKLPVVLGDILKEHLKDV
jgi:flagellin-specific chaperone FliS